MSSAQMDSFLAAYPPSVQETALAARRLLTRAFPDIEETVDQSARMVAFGYGPGNQGLLCTLIMSQTGVKLGIAHGAELPDPNHLLAGAGKVHRHVQLRNAADVKQPGLNQLLKDALAAWRRRNAAGGR